MEIDRILAVAGILIGILGIILAYVFYRRSILTKILGISYTGPIALIAAAAPRVVTFEGREISALYRTLILLWNRGSAPIEESDFIQPIQVSSSLRIAALKIFDKDPTAAIEIDIENNFVKTQLLRPGEAVVLLVDIENGDEPPNFDVKMKSANMSVTLGNFRGFYPGVLMFAAGTIVFALSVFISNHVSASLQHTAYEKPIAAGIVFGMLVATFGAIFLAHRFARPLMKRIFSPVLWNFFELQAVVPPKARKQQTSIKE